MCLAYLALDRFRYRREVEQAADEGLATLDQEGDGKPDPPQSIENNDAILELKWLARKNCNGFKPSGFWAWIYAVLFRREVDVGITILLGTLSALTLATGVAMKIERWAFIGGLDAEPWIGRSFYICLAATTFPPICVYLGRHLIKWGTARSKHLDNQIAGILQLRVPDTPAPALPDKQ